MESESAINIFKKLPETKEQITNYKKLVRQSLEDDEIDPLIFSKIITALEKLTKELKQDTLIKDIILQEAEKYGQNYFEHVGAKFQIKEVGVTYDFDNCGDPVWEDLNNELQKIQQKKKSRETFLKTISPNTEIYGPDGTMLKPPIKKSTTQLITILK